MKILLSLAAAFAAVTASPLLAQPAGSATIAVHTADLDLRSPAGVAALDRRIRAAVELACGDLSDVDLHGKNAAQRCRAETRAQVTAQRAIAIALTRQAGGTTLAAQ
jgi:UrcA family protein